MDLKQLLMNVAKLIFCGLALFVGMIAGGMAARGLQLTAPPMPAGTDANTILLYMVLTNPILALALATLARNLAGGFLTRTLALSFLAWIAYTINNQLDASLYMPGSVDLQFAGITSLVSSLLCGIAVAWLFPADDKGHRLTEATQAFFGSKSVKSWAWRLALAGVAFIPIYFFFGQLVIPFTRDYYQQNMYGLRLVGLDQVLPMQFVRSLLFLLACLPVLVLWQRSALGLFVRLGLALSILVGLQTTTAYWMPLSIRLPHTLEIMADSFVYAGVLVVLLARRDIPAARQKTAVQQTAAV